MRQLVRFYSHTGEERTWAYGYGDTAVERYTCARLTVEFTLHVHKWGAHA